MAVFSESKMNTGRKILISETCHNARIPFQVHLWTLTQLTITFLKVDPECTRARDRGINYCLS